MNKRKITIIYAILCVGFFVAFLPLAAQDIQPIEQPEIECAGTDRPEVEQLIRRINSITLAAEPKDSIVAREFLEISEFGQYVDVMIKELFLCVDLPDTLMRSYIDNFSLDSGRWRDIDYQNDDRSGWQPSFHAVRLYTLARAYYSAGSAYYRLPILHQIIMRGVDYWNTAGHLCANWWYNEIGVLKLMGPVYLLIKSEMTNSQLAAGLAVMNRAKFGMTGQNKVALASNVLIRALMADDMALVRKAREQIVSEIYISSGEGLQTDYSFHQHGPMMQFGNYGLAYIASMAYWGRVFAGTDLALDKAKTDILSRYALQALRWTFWRGSMDIASCGRQIFISSPRGKAHAMALAMINMQSLDTANRAEYEAFVAENQSARHEQTSLLGSRMFWRSDYLINRTKNWFASVRMSSNRTYGFETTNAENLQGHYSADGVSQVYVDGDEYENIFPVWDWRQLPGLTAQNNGRELSTKYNYYSNVTDFVGGISVEGMPPMAAMKLSRDLLTARKSYFMVGDMMVCLGAGICSDNSLPTTTAIEQSRLLQGVTYGVGRRTFSLPRGQEFTSTDVSWIHQNKVGYVMLSPMELTVSAKSQQGSWSRLARFYRHRPQIEKDVFKVVISHGTNPQGASYAYAVLPGRTSRQSEQMARRPTVRVVRNDAQCQAVSFAKGEALLATFYEAGAVKLDNLYVEVRSPALISALRSGGGYRVAVSDPTQKLTGVTLLVGRSKATARSYFVDLPSGGGSGRSVVCEL
ncbi:MAG: polysaccharide lyase family 8 super-sandwich domain-containing protein [Mucinivorans sp.]